MLWMRFRSYFDEIIETEGDSQYNEPFTRGFQVLGRIFKDMPGPL